MGSPCPGGTDASTDEFERLNSEPSSSPRSVPEDEECELPEFTHRSEARYLATEEDKKYMNGHSHPRDHLFVPRAVAYRELPEMAMFEGLEQFAGAATFLAGFVLADFSGYEFGAWPAPVLAEIYIVMMSFVVGTAVFCSVMSIAVLLAGRRVLDWDLDEACSMRRPKKKYIRRKKLNDDQLSVLDIVQYRHVLPLPFPPYPRPFTFTSTHRENAARHIQESGCNDNIKCIMIDGPLKTHGFDLFPYAMLMYLLAVSLSALRNHLVPWHFGGSAYDWPAFVVRGNLDDGLEIEDGNDSEPTLHGWIALLGVPAVLILYFGIPMCFYARGLLRVFR